MEMCDRFINYVYEKKKKLITWNEKRKILIELFTQDAHSCATRLGLSLIAMTIILNDWKLVLISWHCIQGHPKFLKTLSVLWSCGAYS